LWYSITKMNEMKNTKTNWTELKRIRASKAEEITAIQRANRHVLICDVIMSASIGAIIVLLAIHFTQ